MPTYYIFNETDDYFLLMTPTTGSSLPTRFSAPPRTQTFDTDTGITSIVGNIATSRRADGSVFVPPGGYATTTGGVEITRHYPTSVAVALGQAVQTYLQSKIEDKLEVDNYLKNRSADIVKCLEGVRTVMDSYSTNPTRSVAPLDIIDPIINEVPTCGQLFKSIEDKEKPPLQKQPLSRQLPRNLNDAPTLPNFLTKNPSIWEKPLNALARIANSATKIF